MSYVGHHIDGALFFSETKSFCFFFNDTATTEIYTLSLHDALPISLVSNEGMLITPSSEPEPLLPPSTGIEDEALYA